MFSLTNQFSNTIGHLIHTKVLYSHCFILWHNMSHRFYCTIKTTMCIQKYKYELNISELRTCLFLNLRFIVTDMVVLNASFSVSPAEYLISLFSHNKNISTGTIRHRCQKFLIFKVHSFFYPLHPKSHHSRSQSFILHARVSAALWWWQHFFDFFPYIDTCLTDQWQTVQQVDRT